MVCEMEKYNEMKNREQGEAMQSGEEKNCTFKQIQKKKNQSPL